MTNTVQAHNHSSWIEVRTGALEHNLSEVRGLVGERVKILAVVKADAYGHGAVGTARILAGAGADYLGVTTLEEALELRSGGLSLPILVFSPLLNDQFVTAIEKDLEQTVCDRESALMLSKAALNSSKTARVHVKVDTGMGRLGILPEECSGLVRCLAELPGIEISGIYTHFARAVAGNISSARAQNARFTHLLEALKAEGLPTGLRHAANSPAILNLPESYYDMVRPGTILYGQYPTRHAQRKLDLQDTWTLKTRITALRRLPAGAGVGYGSEYTTKRETVAAVIPIGYSDGFTLLPESVARRKGGIFACATSRLMGRDGAPCVIVRERPVPVIGRVSMQMCSVDVTDIAGVEVGEEVTIPARRTTASNRIPRIFIP